MISLTAATLRAILCFIDPVNTPKIAATKDHLALLLIEKIKAAVGEKDGSQSVYISFSQEEQELQEEFCALCVNIQSVFRQLEFVTSH